MQYGDDALHIIILKSDSRCTVVLPFQLPGLIAAQAARSAQRAVGRRLPSLQSHAANEALCSVEFGTHGLTRLLCKLLPLRQIPNYGHTGPQLHQRCMYTTNDLHTNYNYDKTSTMHGGYSYSIVTILHVALYLCAMPWHYYFFWAFCSIWWSLVKWTHVTVVPERS